MQVLRAKELKKTLLCGCIIFQNITFAQKPLAVVMKDRSDSFEKFCEGKIKEEVSFITISGGKYETRDSLISKHLVLFETHNYTDTSLELRHNNTKIKIFRRAFDTSGVHMTVMNGGGYKNYLAYIRNKPFWGTDGGFPKTCLQKVSVNFGDCKVAVPDSAITDLFEPNLCYYSGSMKNPYCLTSAYYSQDKSRLYIYMLNGDGAGGYEVTFVFENKRYIRRVVDYGF